MSTVEQTLEAIRIGGEVLMRTSPRLRPSRLRKAWKGVSGITLALCAAGAIWSDSFHFEPKRVCQTESLLRTGDAVAQAADRGGVVLVDAPSDAKTKQLRRRADPDLVDTVGDDFIDRTLQVWQRRSSRELTREDARQIAINTTGFFKILAEWDARAKREGQAREDMVESIPESST